jgi:hypothetical protein
VKSSLETLKVLLASQYCCHLGSIAEGLYLLVMLLP